MNDGALGELIMEIHLFKWHTFWKISLNTNNNSLFKVKASNKI